MRHPVVFTTTLSSIVLAWCVCARALDPSLDMSQYAHTAWKVREGFAKGQILSIAQTPDGYLWLGTEFGLFHFDGVRNVSWQPAAGQHLPSSLVFSLLASRDGTLWIGTTKGLASWKNGRFIECPELAGLVVFSLLEDRDGTVWAGAIGFPPPGRLCAIHGNSIHCYGEDGSLGAGVHGLYEDGKGTLWALTRTGIWRWKPGTAQFYPLLGEPSGFGGPAEDSDGALVFPMRNEIGRVVNGKIEPYTLPRRVDSFQPRSVLRDRDGALWIGTSDRGLLHVHQGRIDAFTSSDGLSSDHVNAIFEDREGNVWVATNDGLDRFRELAVTTFTKSQGLAHATVASISADQHGALWLSTFGGLDRWENGRIVPYDMRDGKINGLSPDLLFQDRSGRMWVSTLHEFGYLQNDRFVRLSGVPGGAVHSITEDADGNFWIAHEGIGLIRLSKSSAVQQIPWAALGRKDGAAVVAADPMRGGIWLGFIRGGLSYLADGAIRNSYTSVDGLGEGRVNSVRIEHDDTLWAATEGGLSRLKDGHFSTLNSQNGLPCDAVHWAIEDDDNSLWLYMPCGLVNIARSEIDVWLKAADRRQDAKQKVQFVLFDSSDGVRTIPRVGLDAQVAKSPDGKLWFLPMDGVSVIDPHHIPFNKLPPPVRIEQITVNGKTYGASNELRLPPQAREVEITFAALSFVDPGKVHFRYKLEGFNRNWHDVDRRQVYYANLPAGNYRFRVLACNNSGVWNEAGASLEFSVLPAFYQTTWFRILCFFGSLVLLWSIYRLRIQQMQRQFNIALDARVNERTRIARELHDTLLQTFHGAMFQFQAARNLMSRRPEEALRSLDDAISETKKALGESREAIQDLRSEPIAKGNLAEFLMSISPELAGSNSDEHPPVFDLIEEGERQVLSSTVSKEICRIALELTRNAHQHAHARRIEAEIRYGESMFRLRIRDDGKGIDPQVLKEGGKLGHWGLRGVRERAERIGARLDLWSEPGSGTEVQLLVPASVAYENRRDGYRARLFRRVKRRA